MARILRDPNTKGVGAPRGQATDVSARVSMGGGAVAKDTVRRLGGGIRRLIARDPAKGVSANIGTSRDVLGGFRKGVQAFFTTAMAGANNDMTFTSKVVGVLGNSTRVRIVVAGVSTPLSVSVAGSDITINSATDGGGLATSTANDVIAAVKASAPASALVDVALAAGNDGTGVVAAFAYTNLASGADSIIEGVNAVDAPNPRILDGTGYKRRSVETRKNVVNRGVNRSVKKS